MTATALFYQHDTRARRAAGFVGLSSVVPRPVFCALALRTYGLDLVFVFRRDGEPVISPRRPFRRRTRLLSEFVLGLSTPPALGRPALMADLALARCPTSAIIGRLLKTRSYANGAPWERLNPLELGPLDLMQLCVSANLATLT